MDIVAKIQESSPELTTLLFSSIIVFITWLIKSIIEKPIENSRSTFVKYFEKRIQVLSEINANLNFIAYFPNNTEFKENLQRILLDGMKSAYISKEIFDYVTRIAIEETTDENLTLKTIKKIDEELEALISKVRQENKFYYKYSDIRPVKRIFKLFFLFLMYIVAAIIILSLFLLAGYLVQKIISINLSQSFSISTLLIILAVLIWIFITGIHKSLKKTKSKAKTDKKAKKKT